ncbi:MAG TPA: hypothetical protein VJ717_01105 [Gemmatimonadaceae bacterium]|nr:hypothetical protein [Gemmatimonadaceae bacterium]
MEPATKKRLAGIGETGLGIVLALVPVALWVAWTTRVWVIVVAVGVVAAALLVALGYWGPQADECASDAKPELPDEAIAAIQEVFPLTYHHSFRQTARFRRAMDALRRVL